MNHAYYLGISQICIQLHKTVWKTIRDTHKRRYVYIYIHTKNIRTPWHILVDRWSHRYAKPSMSSYGTRAFANVLFDHHKFWQNLFGCLNSHYRQWSIRKITYLFRIHLHLPLDSWVHRQSFFFFGSKSHTGHFFASCQVEALKEYL